MKKIILLAIAVLMLTGCDNRKCIESHEEEDTCFYYIYNKVGSVTTMTPIYYNCTKTVCDKYEEE